MQEIVLYTDGSCYPNDGTGPGGWAFKCRYKGQSVVKYGHKPRSTNNEMELAAIYYALRYIPTGVNQISVFTDSSYCYNTLTKWGRDWKIGNWKTATGSDVKNKELISELLDVLDLHLTHREVKFTLVKGHSGIEDNEDVDKAAKKARVESVTNWTKKNEGVLHTKRVEERTGSGEKSSSRNGSRNRYKATQSR